MATEPRRGPERGAGAGERVEHGVAHDREHADEPLGDLGGERRRPPSALVLPSAADVGPDLGEPPVAFGLGIAAFGPARIAGRERAKRAFPEEEDELAIQRDVGVRREEPRAEEGVRPVGGFLPEDVGERPETERFAGRNHAGVVRPETKLAFHPPQRVPDVDREDAARKERAVTRDPGRIEQPVHPLELARPLGAKKLVPLREHRVGGRGDNKRDGSGGDPRELARVSEHQLDGTDGHARSFVAERDGHQIDRAAFARA